MTALQQISYIVGIFSDLSIMAAMAAVIAVALSHMKGRR